MVERGAIRLFWRAEHLDPSEEGDVPDDEAFGDSFPAGLSERKRQFWRYLMIEGIRAMREPTEGMIKVIAAGCQATPECEFDNMLARDRIIAMFDAALADE